MKKIIFAVLAVLVVTSAAGAYWYGNQPKLTYYPSGSVETSVEQKLYKENGEYKFFNEDGTLAQKYNVVDGVRNGAGYVYAGAVTAEVNYSDGELLGALKLDTKGKVPELENLDIELSGKEFTIKYKEAEEKANTKVEAKAEAAAKPEVEADIEAEVDVKAEDKDGTEAETKAEAEVEIETQNGPAPERVIGGRIVCSDEEFLTNMQAFLSVQNLNNFNAFTKCLSLTSGLYEDEMLKCEYKGAYQYPKFTAESRVECSAKGYVEELVSAMYMNVGIEGLGKMSSFIEYKPSDKKFSFNVVDDKGIYSQTQSFKGLEEVISSGMDFAFSKQESKDLVKFASEVLKNFTAADSQLAINGKVVSAVRGDFNFMKGFSNPWTASFFGIENTITSQMKITDKGVVMNIAYPISKKPLLSLGIQIDDVFKERYQSFIDLVMKEFSENSEDVAAGHIMAKLPEYAMQVSDVVKSINALLMNNRGEKVMGAVLNVKPDVDFMSLSDDILKAFNIKIISYKNNKPSKVVSGDTVNGFMAEGKVLDPTEIVEYLDTEALDEVSKQVDKEYSQVYKLIQENKYPSDPFIRGFYEGYNKAMQVYKGSQIAEQINQLSLNIRTVYADNESYANLNNELAIILNVVPREMLLSDKYVINAVGGKVEIFAAPAYYGDNEQASFVLKFDGLAPDACMTVASADWDAESGIMALGVNKDVSNMYLDEVENKNSKKCNEAGVLCAAEGEMDVLEASSVCKNAENAIYIKFQ